MKILILWSSLADYTLACFKQLASKTDVTIRIVYQPIHANAPFNAFDLSYFEQATEDIVANRSMLMAECINYKPDITLMASWNFKHYMSISKACKKNGSKVISAFDNQWNNTIKQNIGRVVSPYFLKPAIDNFFVPGDRQAQMAFKFGYSTPFYGFYCANSRNFEQSTYNSSTRNFLFIGRLIEQKGISTLINAYKHYRLQVTNPWNLIVAGTGPLKHLLEGVEGIVLRSFVQPENLGQLFTEASCFVLPSKHENWGLVIHEAALAGQPIICTANCGASTWFVRDGLNGYITDVSETHLCDSLIKMHQLQPEAREVMSQYSFKLAKLWTVEKWADSLYANILNLLK